MPVWAHSHKIPDSAYTASIAQLFFPLTYSIFVDAKERNRLVKNSHAEKIIPVHYIRHSVYFHPRLPFPLFLSMEREQSICRAVCPCQRIRMGAYETPVFSYASLFPIRKTYDGKLSPLPAFPQCACAAFWRSANPCPLLYLYRRPWLPSNLFGHRRLLSQRCLWLLITPCPSLI